MKVLVVGATGGSGRAVVAELVRRGHEVTALSRHGSQLTAPRVRGVDGDATHGPTVDALVRGQDAVVVTLGISESDVWVRLRGPAGTASDVRSRGTARVIDAMHRHGVRRLVVQTSYGVGATRSRLPWMAKALFAVLLAPQIADHEVQARAVHDSGLDWVEAQPVNLTDEENVDQAPFVSVSGDTDGSRVSRREVARALADAVETDAYLGQTIAVSRAVRDRTEVSV